MMPITKDINELLERLDDDLELTVYAVALIQERMRRVHLTLDEDMSDEDVMDALDEAAERFVDAAFHVYYADPVIH